MFPLQRGMKVWLAWAYDLQQSDLLRYHGSSRGRSLQRVVLVPAPGKLLKVLINIQVCKKKKKKSEEKLWNYLG